MVLRRWGPICRVHGLRETGAADAARVGIEDQAQLIEEGGVFLPFLHHLARVIAAPRDLLGAGHGRAQPWGSLPRLPLVAWEQACPGVDGGAWRRDHAHLPPQTLITVPVPLLERAEDVAAWRERLDAVESTAWSVGDGEASVPARVG